MSANARVRVGHSDLRKEARNNIGSDDADQKANDEQRQFDACLLDRLLQSIADQDHHIEHQQRAQKVDVAEIVDGFVIRIVGQADDRVGPGRAAEMVTRDEKAGDRTADQTRDDQSERRRCDADFERIGDAEALADDRRPRDRSAVSADERGGAHERSNPLGQTERRNAAGRNQILDHQIDQRQSQKDKERPPAGNEVVEPGVEADAGEEIEQQHVARIEREADFNAKNAISQQGRRGREQTARHGLRNVPASERLDQAIKPGAGEEHENGDCERKQPGDVNRRHRKLALAHVGEASLAYLMAPPGMRTGSGRGARRGNAQRAVP